LTVWLRVLLLGCLALSACKSDVQSGIQSANDLLYRKQYVEAERLYRKLLKRLESSKDLTEGEDAQRLLVLDRLGKINALYLRDYSQAIADFEALNRKYPKTEPSLAALATVADLYHYRLGKLQQAIETYQRLVMDFPGRAEAPHAQLEVVAAYFKLKDYEQARAEAEWVLKRWPGSPEAAQAEFLIADSHYLQKRYTDAIATYERLLDGKPDANLTALVLFEVGNCYQELNDGDRALNYYYAALSQHPNPALVQRKIQRVRTRLYHLTPSESILNAAHPSRRIAALGPAPAAVAKPAASAAPRQVAVDAGNDENEEERTDGPGPTPPSEGAPIGDKK
jgi:tetratricopeptide (TPR) repeat protein